MTTEEKIEVIRAFDEGKEIEFYDGEEWCKKTTNSWDFEFFEYRIKPQPTRLDAANEFWEKTFGVKNAFDESTCIMNCSTQCCKCVAYKNGEGCVVEKWWNAPCEKEH